MKYVFLIFASLVGIVASATPTQRPLPPGVVDSDPDFAVLRDHANDKLFYIVPKRYEVIENRLETLGKEATECDSVDTFRATFLSSLVVKQKLIAQQHKMIEQINEATDRVQALRTQIEAKQSEKEVLEKEDATEESTKKIEDIEVRLKTLSEELVRAEKPLASLKIQNNEILPNIEEIEASIEKFHEQMIRPAARTHILLRLPRVDYASPEFRHRMGISSDAQVEQVKVIGVSLFPVIDEEADFREKQKRSLEIGTFAPQWSIKPLETRSLSSLDGSISSAPSMHIESEISFENIYSLFSYCTLKGGLNPHRLVTPLRISFAVALWNSSLKKAVAKTLATHRRALDAKAWSEIEKLEKQAPDADFVSPDVGASSLYSNEGAYQTHTYSVSFVFPESSNGGSSEK